MNTVPVTILITCSWYAWWLWINYFKYEL